MRFESFRPNRSVSATETVEKNSKIEKKLYKLETGESIEVTAKEFEYTPAEKTTSAEGNVGANVVFLPGWAMPADSPVVAKLSEAFVERSKGRAFAITTRAEELPGTKDSLYREALAVSKFIKEKGLKNIVLAGHSQGGDKAIDLATILQQDSELHISGLVLLDSIGLYDQDSLAKNFAKDSLMNTPATMAKNVLKNPEAVLRSLRAGNSIVKGIFEELRRSGTDYLHRTGDEITVMERKNSRMDQVKVPVILISGSDDIISHPDKIIPIGEEARMVAEWGQKDVEAGTETYIDPREKYLQKSMFPNSPYVRMVAPEKLANHGLPLFRSESVANASIYLLKRFERREKAAGDDLKSEGL